MLQKKTFRLVVIEYQGIKMFFHAKSGRAVAEYWYGNLPWGTAFELVRTGMTVAKACVTTLGTHAPMDGIQGDAILLEKSTSFPEGWAEKIAASKDTMLVGDELLLRMQIYKPLRPTKRWWSCNQWFYRATQRSRRAVLAERISL